MSKSKRKKLGGIVYSTDPNFQTNNQEGTDPSGSSPQPLTVHLEKKGRGGKQVTLVRGYTGKDSDLKDLGTYLKSRCGVGGSVKDREIIIQGNVRDKVMQLLEEKGFSTKMVGA